MDHLPSLSNYTKGGGVTRRSQRELLGHLSDVIHAMSNVQVECLACSSHCPNVWSIVWMAESLFNFFVNVIYAYEHIWFLHKLRAYLNLRTFIHRWFIFGSTDVSALSATPRARVVPQGRKSCFAPTSFGHHAVKW